MSRLPHPTNPFRTLRGRLTTTYAALAWVAIVASAVYTASSLRGGLLGRVGLDLADEARLVADTLRDPLERDDRASVRNYVLHLGSLTHTWVVVRDRRGEQVAETPPGLSGLPNGEVIEVTVPVTSTDGEVLGSVRATSTLEDVRALLGRLNETTVLVALAVAVVAAVPGWLLATSIARPTGWVAQAALDLARRRPTAMPFRDKGLLDGQPLELLPEPTGSTEEIRALVRAFNSLAEQLRLHEQARREFASDVSHELHSLASAMQTAAEALDRGAAESNPALAQRLVGGLVGHTRRLTRLADDLLELARWEGGRLRIDEQDMDLADLVNGTLDEWTSEAGRRGITLEARVPATPLPIYADPIRLAQALGNLVENALKYAGTGGWVRVEVGVVGRRDYEIAVTDSGPGIPAEVLPRVFERYFRVEGRASGGPGGMGLGLAIARQIVLAHGGALVAESPPGSGARFLLRLPLPSSLPARPRAASALG